MIWILLPLGALLFLFVGFRFRAYLLSIHAQQQRQKQANALTSAYLEGRRIGQESPTNAIMGFVVRSAKRFRVH